MKALCQLEWSKIEIPCQGAPENTAYSHTHKKKTNELL